MEFEGKVFKYGDNVNTDVIIPARYLNDASEDNLRAHAMEDIDADFAKSVKCGDIVVGGKNFGSGSSREHAPLALKASGVKLVIAQSFARIFFRNAINIGLLAVESSETAKEIEKDDVLSINDEIILDKTTGKTYPMPKSDGFVKEIMTAGGLINLLKTKQNS